MPVKNFSLSLSTNGNADIHDITDQVANLISKSRLTSGTATIFCPSSTSALTTIEYESGALNDLRQLFDEIVPVSREYAHNERWHDGNGHSHLQATLLGPSLTVPIAEGKLVLGTWQQIFHLECDVPGRQRTIVVTVVGA